MAKFRPLLPTPLPQDPLPKFGLGAVPPPSVIWKFIQRLTIRTAVVDTSSLGDLPLPRNGLQAKVLWSALDTSANTSASFGSVQVAMQGGAFDVAIGNYVWADKVVVNTAAGATTEGIAGSPNGGDSRWAAFVTTGGGTGGNFRSRGRIYLQDYSDPTQSAMAWWDTQQVNQNAVARRMGDGYHVDSGGPLTALRFTSGAGSLAVGTYFELWVAIAA